MGSRSTPSIRTRIETDNDTLADEYISARSTPSIRTRIETANGPSVLFPGLTRSTPSIRTRIETINNVTVRTGKKGLEVHHPLEQGLKHNFF